MQRLEVSCAVRHIYGSLGAKGLKFVLAKYLLTINEMGWACSMYGGRGEVYTGFWWGNLRKRDHSEDPGIEWMVTLK
jgi:hypothetical protein